MATLGKFASSVVKRQILSCGRFQHFLLEQPFCKCTRRSIHLKTQNKFSPFVQSLRHMTRNSVKSRKTLTPVEEIESATHRNFRSLIKPFGFTILVSGCSFGGAIVWQYETLRGHFRKARDNVEAAFQEQFYGKAGSFRHHINLWWNSLSPGRKLVVGIIGANIAVFGMWKLRPLQSFMMKYFSSSPFAGAPCISMVLSTFSHYSLFHIGANMFVLWSFSAPITDLLGREQFLGFFMTAGVVSGFTSYMYKVARASPIPSLGASGVILAMLGTVCCQYPEARLSIAFVDLLFPHSFSADTAMKSLLVFDAMGMLLGWRLFDHAAHVGGLLFGIWYQKYGKEIVWKRYREPVMKIWHDLRGQP